jgi:hypothetical protein
LSYRIGRFRIAESSRGLRDDPGRWIAARLVELEATIPAKPTTAARTLADLFEGHIGHFEILV